MDSLLILGASGFVGTNLAKFFNDDYTIIRYRKHSPLVINQTIVIHLAGKAHDLKKTSNPAEYYQVNTEFTKIVFDLFLDSDAKVFITLSSVKAVVDEIESVLTEEHIPNPITHYRKS